MLPNFSPKMTFLGHWIFRALSNKRGEMLPNFFSKNFGAIRFSEFCHKKTGGNAARFSPIIFLGPFDFQNFVI